MDQTKGDKLREKNGVEHDDFWDTKGDIHGEKQIAWPVDGTCRSAGLRAGLFVVAFMALFMQPSQTATEADSFGPLPEARIPWSAVHENDGTRVSWFCEVSGCRYELEPVSATVAPPEPVVEPVVPWKMPRDIVRAHFPGQGDYAYSVFWCESKLDPGAIGAAGERGVAQIHPIWFKTYGVPPADLEGQVAQAAVIVGDIGWAHWSCA